MLSRCFLTINFLVLIGLSQAISQLQWSPATGTSGANVKALATNGTSIFAGLVYGSTGALRSTDNGQTWLPLTFGLAFEPSVNALVATEGKVFAGLDGLGVYRSTDNGATWQACNSGLGLGQVFALTTSGLYIFAGGPYNGASYPGGIYRSADYGNTWTRMSNGLTSSFVQGLGANGTSVFAGTSDGVFRSTDNGENWTLVNSGFYTPLSLQTFARSGSNFFGGSQGNGLWVTSNNGELWARVEGGMTAPAIAALATWGTAILAGDNGLSSADHQGGIFISTDGGNSWQTSSIGLLNTQVLSLVVTNDGVALAGTYGGGIFRASFEKHVTLDIWPAIKINNVAPQGLSPVQVAILSSQDFDASTVDPLTARFGPAGATPIRDKSILVDINRDRKKDLILAFKANETGIACGDQTATLRARTRDGQAIQGTGDIRTICPGNTPAVDQYAGEALASEDALAADLSGCVLEQNHPNPFNPTTTIRYNLPHRAHVTLAVFNTLGQKVADLVNADIDAGYHSVEFNASTLASGMYFYRMQAGSYLEVKKMLIMK